MFPAATKDFRGTGILFLMLFLGGISSLFLNFAFPAHSRRLRLKTALSQASSKIDDLPMQMDSATRMSVMVEHRQLTARLRALKWFDTQTPTETTEIDRGVDRLRLRLAVIEEAEMALNRYWRRRARSLPLNVIDDIEDMRRQLQDILRRSDPADPDIQAARTLTKKMDECLSTVTATIPDVADRLIKQTMELKAQFNETSGELGTSPVWADIRSALGRRFDEVLGNDAPTTAAGIPPRDYSALGRAIFTLEQLRDFLRLCGAAGPKATLSDDQQALKKRLVDYLGGGAWDDLKRAERLVRQMHENISEATVETAITRGQARVEMSRSLVRQFEPTVFRLVFDDQRVNASAARANFTYRWDFGHDGLTEPGWSVSHYFPQATRLDPPGPPTRLMRALSLMARTFNKKKEEGKEATFQRFLPPYKLTVRCIKLDGNEVPVPIERLVDVRPPLRVTARASAWMEVLRLFLALGIAAAGLIAGAREQILKFDLLPALIAVFLLGFGSDRLKNVFTSQAPSTADEAKPQPKGDAGPPGARGASQ